MLLDHVLSVDVTSFIVSLISGEKCQDSLIDDTRTQLIVLRVEMVRADDWEEKQSEEAEVEEGRSGGHVEVLVDTEARGERKEKSELFTLHAKYTRHDEVSRREGGCLSSGDGYILCVSTRDEKVKWSALGPSSELSFISPLH